MTTKRLNPTVSREATRFLKVKTHLWLVLTRAVLTSVLAVPLASNAAITKCTGADGKVVFSDQPCSAGQSAETIKGAGGSKPSAVSGKPDSPPSPHQGMPSMRNSLDAALTPECRQIQKQMFEQVTESATKRLTEPELQSIYNRFEAQCKPLIKAAQDAEWAKGAAERDRLQKQVECTEKRRVYDERKDKLASLDDSGRATMARLRTDLDTACR